jgi:hypothetical protein
VFSTPPLYLYSGKHKVVSREPFGARDFRSGTKKKVVPKKKDFATRNLKDCLPSLPLKTRKQKKKIKVFYPDNFMLP